MPTLSPSLDATLARADLCARKTDRFGIAIFALRIFAVGESILIEDPILAIDAVALMRAHHLHPIFASATERHGLSAEASTACALHAMCEAGAAQRARIALLHTHAEDEEDQPSVVGHYRRRLLGVSRSLLANVEFCTSYPWAVGDEKALAELFFIGFINLHGSQLLELSTRFAHSCDPNAACVVHAASASGMRSVQYIATRNISTGEMITFSYEGAAGAFILWPTHLRQRRCRALGFACACSRCEENEEAIADATRRELEAQVEAEVVRACCQDPMRLEAAPSWSTAELWALGIHCGSLGRKHWTCAAVMGALLRRIVNVAEESGSAAAADGELPSRAKIHGLASAAHAWWQGGNLSGTAAHVQHAPLIAQAYALAGAKAQAVDVLKPALPLLRSLRHPRAEWCEDFVRGTQAPGFAGGEGSHGSSTGFSPSSAAAAAEGGASGRLLRGTPSLPPSLAFSASLGACAPRALQMFLELSGRRTLDGRAARRSSGWCGHDEFCSMLGTIEPFAGEFGSGSRVCPVRG